jgi:thioredoxin 1
MQSIIDVNDETFDDEVLNSPKPVLAYFYARVGSCRGVTQLVEEIAIECGAGIKVVKIDTDASPRVSLWWCVSSVPTILTFDQGSKVSTLVGAVSKGALIEQLQADQLLE